MSSIWDKYLQISKIKSLSLLFLTSLLSFLPPFIPSPSLPPSLSLSVPSIRLTGYSPFQGETHSHTFYNVSMCEYDFEDEVFDDVSQEAKDFIEELLQKKPRF